MLVVEYMSAASETEIGITIARRGGPDAVFFFIEGFVDSVLHVIGYLNHRDSSWKAACRF
jgi:hypothetical protein